jgi:hypothetical protein
MVYYCFLREVLAGKYYFQTKIYAKSAVPTRIGRKTLQELLNKPRYLRMKNRIVQQFTREYTVRPLNKAKHFSR